MREPKALGWTCPWSGDDNDPIPPRYWLWFRLYAWTRRIKHWAQWHDWEASGQRWRCHWCGARS